MRFEFATSSRIVFGSGTCGELADLMRPVFPGVPRPRLLVITGASGRGIEELRGGLAGVFDLFPFAVAGEPTTATIEAAAALARELRCDGVLGFGGGSAIDAAKATAAIAVNPGILLDYLEVIGQERPLEHPPLPCVAVPTTAGTGSEVTRNAVVSSPQHGVKVSLRHPSMLPRLAVIDPELTHELPPALTASTGLDALTQLIEPFVSVKANPMTDALCREGMERAARALPVAYRRGEDAAAREDMCIASLFGGMALANAGLGAVHGFAGPIGGMFPAPHGAVCAALLPHVTAANIQALRERALHAEALTRYQVVARLLTGSPSAGADEGVAHLQALAEQLEIPPLRAYGVKNGDIPRIVEKVMAASSMKGNPIPLMPSELTEVLSRAI